MTRRKRPMISVAVFAILTGIVMEIPSMETVRLNDGDVFSLTAGAVSRRLLESEYPGYGYNGSIPGPILRVRRGTSVRIPFTNNLPEPTTVHWHGLRHDIRYDGVPGISQEPVNPGETFVYDLHFRDAGVFWYHPHVREDRQQNMGLYGVIIVEDDGDSRQELREEVLIINDILVHRTEPVPFLQGDLVDHALMGRFGNVVTVNGNSRGTFEAVVGETVRFHLLNVASARPYRVVIDGAGMKLVGSDIGPVARQQRVDGVLIAPAERYTVDVHFPAAGEYTILDRTPAGDWEIGSIQVRGSTVSRHQDASFDDLREHHIIDASLVTSALRRQPDAVLEIDVTMGMMMHGGGMAHGNVHQSDRVDGIEWYDDMPMMNASSTNRNTRWFFREPGRSRQNETIRLRTESGSYYLLRLVNRADSPHPMHHPVHLHGQRFVVLREDGRENDNLAWKDTVLVRAGATVDILVEADEPGQWMLHCHIPEHMEAGMVTILTVGD